MKIFRTVRDREETYSNTVSCGKMECMSCILILEIPLGDDSELDHLLRYIKENNRRKMKMYVFGHIIKKCERVPGRRR